MPHYGNGTEAKVGDHVTGKLYNTIGIRAGTIISITPGQDSCNAMVAFVEVVHVPSGDAEEIAAGKVRLPHMVVRAATDKPGMPPPRYRIVRGEAHGSAGAHFAVFECADYCAVNELTKVG